MYTYYDRPFTREELLKQIVWLEIHDRLQSSLRESSIFFEDV